MPSSDRRKAAARHAKVVRDISVQLAVWEWLKKQPGGASAWIDFTAGAAMKRDEHALLKTKLRNALDEIRRLTDELNAARQS